MARRTQAIIALIAVLAALGVGLYVYRAFDRMVTTAEVVTPAQPIPAGALIEAPMLARREVPRPFTQEAIYESAAELVGRVATVPLHPGMVIYEPFAVPQREYRLVDDPRLEVVSFPVDPARAVGGQLQPGHRLDIWRLVSVRPSSEVALPDLAADQWATATLLVEAAPVVDVRAASGLAVARSPQAIPGEVEEEGRRTTSPGTSGALQILTVGVPREVARTILTVVAEERAGAELWVSLAPLVTGDPAEGASITTPVPAKTGTATPTAAPITGAKGVVRGPAGEGLPVRSGPGGAVIGILPEGTAVKILKGVTLVEGVPWCMVETADMSGWVALEYVEVER